MHTKSHRRSLATACGRLMVHLWNRANRVYLAECRDDARRLRAMSIGDDLLYAISRLGAIKMRLLGRSPSGALMANIHRGRRFVAHYYRFIPHPLL